MSDRRMLQLQRLIQRLRINLCHGNHDWVVLRQWEHIGHMNMDVFQLRQCAKCELQEERQLR